MTNTKLTTPVKADDGTITEAVHEITWTDGKITAGQYEGDVAFGQLPDDTGQLAFKALRTCSDGKTVRWIEAASSGDEEPENPAPVVESTAEDAQDEDEDEDDATAPETTKTGTAATTEASDSDLTARGLGVAGLVVGVLGPAAAACASARGRSLQGRGE